MRHNASRYSRSRYEEPVPFAVTVGSIAAVAGAALIFIGPIGYRFGLLSLQAAADQVFVWGAYLGGLAALLSLVGLLAAFSRRRDGRRGTGRAVLALLVGAVAFRAGGRIPFMPPAAALADVTTDTTNPPVYVSLPQMRGDSAPPLVYPGEPLASQQKRAYPDITPLVLSRPKDEVFARALGAIRRMGWTLVAADGPAGRIEASASTRLFGTIDDVIVRVVAQDGGSRVDVRAVSREPDGGRNSATRVRSVLRALSAS
jgi:hypothetical protein